MATLLLSAAGSAAGGAIGGTFLGVSAATIGQVAGATAGALVDQRLFRSGSQPVEVGRARSLRIQSSTEGVPIPQVYGRMRVSGQVIWSTKYLEKVRTTTSGGKGGIGGSSSSAQTVREFSYCISFAVSLCEGVIDRVGRIWADGKLLDTQGLTIRVYRGDQSQPPDPKIMAVEGAGVTPAYRGTAYVVFEDLPLEQFGDRIPQLNFEVFRAPPEESIPPGPERGARLSALVRGVALSPGSGEFALDTEAVRYLDADGARFANVNNSQGRPDALVALDQLDADLPQADAVSVIISWFGTDLRCGECRIEPRVEQASRLAAPQNWSVSGLTSATATLVSRDAGGRPVYGGTPSDASVIKLIRELKARGKKVMLYPFILMDVPPGNTLPDPYTGTVGQPAFPWRGRITASVAPGEPGSPDQTAALAPEVEAFFGAAEASDFTIQNDSVTYSGPAEFTMRRFILHCAALGAAAGGVDAICIGSEMRELTPLRSARTVYPAVGEFLQLANQVAVVLPQAQIGYAADWSEYFGHQPQDGSGDAIFHLDPLWASPSIDFIGIDDYTPLSDWRHETDHLDRLAGAQSVYSLPYLTSQIEGGEYYDYFYADETARELQDRSPITDGASNEPWIFRSKDIRSWWSNPHHNRIGGVRQPTPTAWVPRSKPVWLTETGCPAVDLGANMPNLFYDPKSSESALPFGSVGARDDEMQRRFLQAKLAYWQTPGVNPNSTVYPGKMIPDDCVFVWTWDSRPFPDFPVRESVWSDGPLYDFGHWLTGRVSSSGLAEVVADICRQRGIFAIDVSGLFGTVDGYQIDATQSARQALQPLMLAYGFDAFEAEDRIVFRMRDLRPSNLLESGAVVAGADPANGPVLRERTSAGDVVDAVRVTYIEAESDYRIGAVEVRQNA
ncbi:MAG: glycoside hydrolase/phage tail family protein, partial [Pseudomonadota bacterium]